MSFFDFLKSPQVELNAEFIRGFELVREHSKLLEQRIDNLERALADHKHTYSSDNDD